MARTDNSYSLGTPIQYVTPEEIAEIEASSNVDDTVEINEYAARCGLSNEEYASLIENNSPGWVF